MSNNNKQKMLIRTCCMICIIVAIIFFVVGVVKKNNVNSSEIEIITIPIDELDDEDNSLLLPKTANPDIDNDKIDFSEFIILE